jgi:hypothetical protein
MTSEGFQHEILAALEGAHEESEGITRDRLDWGGMSAVLALYDRTAGHDRDEFIKAVQCIIEDGDAEPTTLAQVIQIASSLDLSQAEPSVKRLQEERELAREEPVKSAINSFLIFRRVRSTPFWGEDAELRKQG